MLKYDIHSYIWYFACQIKHTTYIRSEFYIMPSRLLLLRLNILSSANINSEVRKVFTACFYRLQTKDWTHLKFALLFFFFVYISDSIFQSFDLCTKTGRSLILVIRIVYIGCTIIGVNLSYLFTKWRTVKYVLVIFIFKIAWIKYIKFFRIIFYLHLNIWQIYLFFTRRKFLINSREKGKKSIKVLLLKKMLLCEEDIFKEKEICLKKI